MDLAQLYKELAPYRTPNVALYFADAGLSATLGWAFFLVALLPIGSGWAGFAILASALALFRALAFIHELVHQREMFAFRVFWHSLVGIPLLLPLLLYLPVHHDHHNTRTYGTLKDGEYEHFTGRLGLMVFKLLALNIALPVALILRFAVLTPLSPIFPIVKNKIIPGFIHLALRIPFHAPPLPIEFRRESAIYEWVCAAHAWLLILLWLNGHPGMVVTWAVLLVIIATLNTIRAMFSTHLYDQRDTGRDLPAQMEDSINLESRGLFSFLMCPVGLQYHALHHLAPQLPYHHLAAAHSHLMKTLSPDSPYRRNTVKTAQAGWQRLIDSTQGLP